VTPARAWTRAAALAAVVLVVDQVTKAIVRADIKPGERVELLPFLDLVHVHNEGIAFGALDGSGLVIVLVLAAVAGILAFFAANPTRRGVWVTAGLMLGGALGNVIDRLHQGHVTDFVKLPHWPAFNVADVAITLGVLSLFLVLDEGRRR
jgi:signal peptidase II